MAADLPQVTSRDRIDFAVKRSSRGAVVGFWIFVVLAVRGLIGVVVGVVNDEWTIAGLSAFTLALSATLATVISRARSRVRDTG
jgi:hypothetical protein